MVGQALPPKRSLLPWNDLEPQMLMKRRDLLSLFGSAVILETCGFQARAALPGSKARIGFITALDQSAAAEFMNAFIEGLAALGYHSSAFDLQPLFANYQPERIPIFLEKLNKEDVDVIITHGTATGQVIKSPHNAPIVYEFSADPIALGFASDLAHPLYNATGVTLMMAELNTKRLELLNEMLPDAHRIVVMGNPLHAGMQSEWTHSETHARKLKIDVAFCPTPNREELENAFTSIQENQPQAMLVFSDSFIVQNRTDIIDFAMKQRIPVIDGWSVMAEAGALCTYGPRLSESYRRVAYFVDRILKGAKAADLPIEQPAVLELVINLKTANALGVAIPRNVLVRADRVIE
jgi:putative ABC transport system substrate-binding protein